MQERAFANHKIKYVWDSEVIEAVGIDGRLNAIRLRNLRTGEESDLPVTGLFIAIGHDPRSDLVKHQVELDAGGYVLQQRLHSSETNVPGVFASGDLVDHTYRQAITAAGSGCAAALDAERWLAALEEDATHLPGPPAGGSMA
jgi:thioredoxin reductase (NADPH)